LGVADAGDTFEADLIRTHECYLVDGKAFVVKLAIPIGEGGDGLFRRSKMPFDFGGWLADGTPVAFDAKRTESERWQWSSAPEHQWLGLQLIERIGGLGFFLVRLQREGEVYQEVRIVRASWGKPDWGTALQECPNVEAGYNPPWDWLEVVQGHQGGLIPSGS
jgi:penicillin-binding protein-related factor A (putative recombinase)